MPDSDYKTSEKKCPLCGSSESQHFFRERNHDLIACQKCELFYIHPYPSNLDEVHNKVSEYQYKKLNVVTPEIHYLAAKQYYQRYYPMVEQELDEATTILDVGCGTGRLLELMKQKKNLQRFGIELNTERVAFAKEKAQCEIYETPLENFSQNKNQRFDVITLMNVLSHIPSFDHLFNAIDRLLAPEGKFILKVGECTKRIKKNTLHDWGTPDHLHFLGMNTIQYICSKYKYKILRHERFPLLDELFSKEKWKTQGRSNLRNKIKKIIVSTPLALTILKKLYKIRYDDTVYSSFIVITKNNSEGGSTPNLNVHHQTVYK